MTIETRRNFINNNNSVDEDSGPDNTLVEIIKDRLYFATIDGTPTNDSQYFYFRTDEEFHYESFYEDFGPLNLAMLYKYCARLQRKMKMLNLSKKRIVHYASSSDERQRINAAYLIGSFAIIYLHKSSGEVWRLFENAQPFIPFRDAALGPSTYDLELGDVFAGVEKAVKHKWLNFDDGAFNVDEYEFYEKVENGDFNWIIPDKILAFCGPHNKAGLENGYPHHSPETYFEYFRERNVSTIVRLNKKLYDARRFTSAGFEHVDLFFVDGSCPSDDIVQQFIDIVERAPGAVAIHCKAGLGRTGTLIGCWMMMKFRVTAPESIAWCRICRPGCVIGPQQMFLIDKQEWCWQMENSISPTSSSSSIISSTGTSGGQSASAVNGLVSQVDEIKISGSHVEPNQVNATIAMALTSETTEVLMGLEGSENGDEDISGEMQVSSLETEGNSQGEQLMRIKGTRGSGRCQLLQTAIRNPVMEDKPVNTYTAKRITPGRARRSVSTKESGRNLKKVNVGDAGVASRAVTGGGPVRKAAKHKAGADASSSISSSGASSNYVIMAGELQLNSPAVRRHLNQRALRLGAPSSGLPPTPVGSSPKPNPNYKSPSKARRSSYKNSSLVPNAISSGGWVESTASKKEKPAVTGPSTRLQQTASSKMADSSAPSKSPSPYFLRRRRSVSNMQTLLLPIAPATLGGNHAAITTSATTRGGHLPEPTVSMASSYSRRTAQFSKSGKTKRVT